MTELGLSETKINWPAHTEQSFLEALSDDTQKIQAFIKSFKSDHLARKDKYPLENIVCDILNYISDTNLSCSKFLYYFFEEIGHDEIKRLLFLGNKSTQPLLYLYIMSDKNLFTNTLIRTLGLNTTSIKKLSVKKFSDESIRNQLSLKLLAIVDNNQPYDILVILLYKFGAKLTTKKPSTRNIEFSDGNILPRAPIHSAIANSDLETFNLLIELDKSRKSLEDKTLGNGHTPLHYTAIYGQLTMTKVLLDKKVKPLVQNLHGQTALHLAIINDSPTILEELLLKIKAKSLTEGLVKAFAVTDENGYTILHYIAMSPNLEFTKLITNYIRQIYFDEKTLDETINKTAPITLNGKIIALSAYHFSYIFSNSSLRKLLYGYGNVNKNTKNLLDLFPINLVNKDNFSTVSKFKDVLSDVYRSSVSVPWTTTLGFDNTVFDIAIDNAQLNQPQQAIRKWINLSQSQIKKTVYILEKKEEKSNNNNAIPELNLNPNVPPAVAITEQPTSSSSNKQGSNGNNAMPAPPNFDPDATYYAGNEQPQLPEDGEKSHAPSTVPVAKQPAPPSQPNSQEPNSNNDNNEEKKPARTSSSDDLKHFSEWHQNVKKELEQQSAVTSSSNIIIKAPLTPMPVYSDTPPSLPIEQILKTYEEDPNTIQTVIHNTLKRENSQISSTVINKEVSNVELQLVAEEKNKALQQEEVSNNKLEQTSTTDKQEQTTTTYSSPPPAPALPIESLNVKPFSPIDITRSLKSTDIDNSKKLPERDEHLRKIRQGIALKPISLSERPVGKTPIQSVLKQGLSLQQMFEKSMEARRVALKYDVGSDDEDKNNEDWEDNQESNKQNTSNRYSMSFAQSITELLKDTEQTLNDNNVIIRFTSQHIKEQIKAKLDTIYNSNTDLRNSLLPQIEEIESNDNNEQGNDKSFFISLSPAWYNQLLDDENAFDEFKANLSQAELN